jgi:recombination protein RecT
MNEPMKTPAATTSNSTLSLIKGLLQKDDVKKRFEEVLGKKAPQFMTSLINTIAGNDKLQKCSHQTIMSAAIVAAALDLPIDSNLGFSAIVPYNDKAQFQMMYKGFIQLAIRSGLYARINCAEVFQDEFEEYNPFSGEVKLKLPKSDGMRFKPDGVVVGYYGYIRLSTGFVKELYMTREEVDIHAKKYSKAYNYDLRDHKKTSKWSTDFDAMGKKTVVKLLLSRWGILSVDLQKAITVDQAVIDIDGQVYADNPADNTLERAEIVDPFKITNQKSIEEINAEIDREIAQEQGV